MTAAKEFSEKVFENLGMQTPLYIFVSTIAFETPNCYTSQEDSSKQFNFCLVQNI